MSTYIKVKIKVDENAKDGIAVFQKKKKLQDFPKYNDLKKEILKSCSSKANLVNALKPTDNFVLEFKSEENLYFPEALNNCIFNNPTFDFLKEKLSLRPETKDKTYKFMIKKQSIPTWKRPEFHKILETSLEKKWKPIYEDIKQQLGLTELEKTQTEYSILKKELSEKEKKIKGEHKNIICNNCFKSNIKGKRFICAECFNYNLCQDCEKLYYQRQIHDRKHTLIQVNQPISEDDDNLKYDCVISNSNDRGIQLDSDNIEQSYQLPIVVSNNGTKNLKNCYIVPIRYGDDYLTCEPFKFEEKVEISVTLNICLMIKLPNSDKNYYEGYFRMFTPKGLPFGQVLFIKAFRYE